MKVKINIQIKTKRKVTQTKNYIHTCPSWSGFDIHGEVIAGAASQPVQSKIILELTRLWQRLSSSYGSALETCRVTRVTKVGSIRSCFLGIGVTDMKVWTMSLTHGRVIKATLDNLWTMSLAHGRVMKTTFEPLKGNTDTRPGASLNNQKNNRKPRLVITRPRASVNIQTSSVAKELHYSPMGEWYSQTEVSD